VITLKREQRVVPISKQAFDVISRAIPSSNPDNLRRRSEKKAPLMEVGIFGDDRKAVDASVFPDWRVVCAGQAHRADVCRIRVQIAEGINKTPGEILIEEQSHPIDAENSRRSRSAAKARQARMSSAVRSGKSWRISSCDIPDAR